MSEDVVIIIFIIFWWLAAYMLFLLADWKWENKNKKLKKECGELKKECGELKDENRGLRVKLGKIEPSDIADVRNDLKNGRVYRNWEKEEDIILNFLHMRERMRLHKARDKITLDSAKYAILSRGIKHIRKCENMEDVQLILEKVDVDFENEYIGLKEALEENRMLKRLRGGETLQVIRELQVHIEELEEIGDMLTGSYREK